MEIDFFKNHLPIRTENLILRQFFPEDLKAYLEFMLDSESTQYLAFDQAQKTEKGATELFNFVMSSYDSENIVHAYAIALADSNQYVGSCGFAGDGANNIECYYSIHPKHRRQGYAYEAMRALFEVLQSIPSIAEIRAYCAPENTASMGLAEKLGFKRIGHVVHPHSGLEGILYRI